MAGRADWAVVEIHGRSPGCLLMERVQHLIDRDVRLFR
jgi:hypothetical protein